MFSDAPYRRTFSRALSMVFQTYGLEARFRLAGHSRVICLGIPEWSYENVCHLNLTNCRPSAIITTDSRLWLLVYNG
jgi:hypothetical protein